MVSVAGRVALVPSVQQGEVVVAPFARHPCTSDAAREGLDLRREDLLRRVVEPLPRSSCGKELLLQL
eukprot:5195601-Prymnesium_polylepis.1